MVFALAATAPAAGPTWLSLVVIARSIAEPSDFMDRFAAEPHDFWSVISTFVDASTFGLFVSVPASIVNIAVLTMFARHGKDAIYYALASGIALGGIAGIAMLGIYFSVLETDPYIYMSLMYWRLLTSLAVPCVLTGGLMGLVHWWIAIRPRRRSRLLRQRDSAVIGAME